MSSIFRTSWSRRLAALLSLLAACSSASKRSASKDGSGGNSGTSGVAGAGGTSGEHGGMGGNGDTPGGAGSGGIPDGSGAGGDGGSSVSPVDVTTELLPEATLNQDYRFALEAGGGSGEGYDWVLDGGRLPRGLTLEEDGTLSGIPLEGGEFEFDVVVTDSDGATGEASLAFHVRQSRWLVYWNQPAENETIPRFSAVDLASETFERTLISAQLPPNLDGADASTVAFSPDGRFLLYQFRVTSTHVGTELRMVDFDDFDASRLEDFDFIVNHLTDELIMLVAPSWSPDSRRVAFNALIEDTSGDLRSPARFGFFEVDDVPASSEENNILKRRPEGSSTTLVEWVSLGTVVFRSAHLDEYGNSAEGPLVQSAWQGDAFGEPVPLASSTGGTYDQLQNIHYLSPATQSAVIALHSQPHCIASIELYRFDDNEAVNMGDTPLLPAPDLTRFAGVSASELKIVDAANHPIATLGPSDCNLIEWSPDGRMLGWVDTAAGVKRYKITRVGANGSTETLDVPGQAGTYQATPGRPRFSSDGRWLGYRADGNLFLARIDAMAVQPAVQVNVDLVAPVGSYRFAPNGRALVYAAAGQIAGLDDLYYVDLSGSAPGPSLRISPDLSGFPNGDKLDIPPPEADQDATYERTFPLWNPWTPDSSKVFFTVRDAGSQLGDALYIVDVLEPEPRPVPVDRAPCGIYSCGMINGIRTQPPR
jgi:hypothetical protein